MLKGVTHYQSWIVQIETFNEILTCFICHRSNISSFSIFHCCKNAKHIIFSQIKPSCTEIEFICGVFMLHIANWWRHIYTVRCLIGYWTHWAINLDGCIALDTCAVDSQLGRCRSLNITVRTDIRSIILITWSSLYTEIHVLYCIAKSP